MFNQYIFKSKLESAQLLNYNTKEVGGFLTPLIDPSYLLSFHYANVYHRRCNLLKASLLSNIDETNLNEYIGNKKAKDFLYSLMLDLEIYGNAFIERQANTFYRVLGYQGRVDENGLIYQINDKLEVISFEGHHIKYFSPSSLYYGEPDYISAVKSIQNAQMADSYNSNFFKNGARPGFGIIFENSSPNKEQLEAFREFFSTNFKGFNNSHKSLVLHTGKSSEGEKDARIRLEKLSGVDDMSFKELKNVSRDEIIASHGVPPRLVGVMTAGQLGSGAELIDQLHSFNETILKPKIQIIESFFQDIGVKLKLKEVDVSNFKDDNMIVSDLVDKKILSLSEAREILGY